MNSVSASLQGAYFALGGANGIAMIYEKDGKKVMQKSATTAINGVSLTPSGNACAVASSDGNLYLYSLPADVVPVTPVETAVPTLPIEPVEGGIFSFSSSPTGASVYIDNAVKGITPVTLPMKAGQYQILIRLAGYNDWTSTINLPPSETVSVVAQMNPAAPVSTPLSLGFLSVLSGLVFAAVLMLRRSDE